VTDAIKKAFAYLGPDHPTVQAALKEIEELRVNSERYRYLTSAVGVILDCSHAGPWKFGDAVDAQVDEWLARKAAINAQPRTLNFAHYEAFAEAGRQVDRQMADFRKMMKEGA
jgi:hypothetical protein